MIFVKGTNKYGEMVVMWLLQLNVGLLLRVLRSSSRGPGSALREKGKTGSNRTNIGERSEPSGSLGRDLSARFRLSRDLSARFRLADFCFPFSPNAKHGPRLLLFLVYRCQLVRFLSFSLSSFSPFVFFKKIQMRIFSQRGQLHNSATLNVLDNKLET